MFRFWTEFDIFFLQIGGTHIFHEFAVDYYDTVTGQQGNWRQVCNLERFVKKESFPQAIASKIVDQNELSPIDHRTSDSHDR